MTPLELLQSQPSSPAITTKLAALRSLFSEQSLHAYLIPSADEHLNEYLPEAKQRRKWISGFTGSAGDFLVGRDQSWLFVDPRYYEQAELEVDRTLIQVSKVGLEQHKTLAETLEELGRVALQTGETFRLGYDPFTTSVSQYRDFQKKVEPCGVTLVPVAENLVDRVSAMAAIAATTAPDYANSPLFALPVALTGETLEQKLDRVRAKLEQANADILPITKLDQLAWLFNLRGWDVPYNPVFIGYAIITPGQAFLFTNLNRIAPELQQQLSPSVHLLPYDRYPTTLKTILTPASRVVIDPKHTTMGTYQLLQDRTGKTICKVSEVANPIEGMKARKNETEIAQMQQANLKASRAKTRTIHWVLSQIASGSRLTEADVAATIEGFYAKEAEFQGLSFNTIAGTGPNSSIVHYGTPNPEQVLQHGELLLLDSGAQYAAGTTDDTRTLAVGEPTPAQIQRYTEVLKAHINCAMQRFPRGTTGAQLDGITRSTLWQAGLDYGHGTGHGVGAFLNVHEGPNGISKRVSEPLEPGMITSIEPGFYEPGWGGIRIENLYVVKEVPRQADSDPVWYYFESLTYIPFDRRLINLSQLDSHQRAWLESYHQAIVAKLSPMLTQDEITWLQSACS